MIKMWQQSQCSMLAWSGYGFKVQYLLLMNTLCGHLFSHKRDLPKIIFVFFVLKSDTIERKHNKLL